MYIDSKEVWKKAEIYDVSRKIIRSVSLEGSSIDVSSLDIGTYIVRLMKDEKIGQVKIVKI